MDPAEVQANIAETSSRLIGSYPLVAGLINVSDAINQLPSASLYPPSLFSKSSTSLANGPSEPLFDQYQRELSILMNPSPSDSLETLNWRQLELERIKVGLAEDVRLFRGGGEEWGRMKLLPPPYSLPDNYTPAPPSSISHDLSSTILSAIDFPFPTSSQLPVTSSLISTNNFNTSSEFFNAFLTANKPTPPTNIFQNSKSDHFVSTPTPAPQSSPDPLRIIDSAMKAIPNRSSINKRPSTRDLRSPSNGVNSMRLSGTPDIFENGKLKETGVESAVKRIKLGSPVRMEVGPSSSARGTVRTNDANDIVESFSDTIIDLFQADDAFVDTPSTSSLHRSPGSASADFFRSTATNQQNQPLLKTNFLKKLIKSLTTISMKRKGEELLEEVGEASIARLLTLLERSWSGIEICSFWPAEVAARKPSATMSPGKGKGKKVTAKKGKGRRKSKGADYDSEDEEMEEEDEGFQDLSMNGDWPEDSLSAFFSGHRFLSDGLLAIKVALLMLTCTSLPKQLYSADLLNSMIETLRFTQEKFIYPILETNPLQDLAAGKVGEIGLIFEGLESTIPLVTKLIRQESMSEEILLSMIYFSLSPFFHEGTIGVRGVTDNIAEKSMKALRMTTLGLARGIFGKYQSQRESILEELLNGIGKVESMKKGRGSIRLRNGSSIHGVSALLLHLVQTISTDLKESVITKLTKKPEDLIEIQMEVEIQEMELDENGEPLQAENPIFVANKSIVEPALESATKSARVIIGFLLQKACKLSGSGKGTSNEAEFRGILDNLIADLLSALRLPEYPAAEVILSVVVRSMMITLGDSKSSVEANSMKGIALDWLGPIAARLRKDSTKAVTGDLSLNEICASADQSALTSLIKEEKELIRQLCREELNEGSVEGAAEYTSSILFRDLAMALVASQSKLEKLSPIELSTKNGKLIKAFHYQLEQLTSSFWDATIEIDVFGPISDESLPSIDLIALRISHAQPLALLYPAILDRILIASESTAVGFRTKSLKGLGLIVGVDENIFFEDNVRRTIENRMLDSSPAVRDATLELIGKYLIIRPELAIRYLPKICERINDTGLSVRKRVVKLLKALFGILEGEEEIVEICRRLVWRVQDEDDGIRELAIDSLEEMWFSKSFKGNGMKENQQLERLSRVIMTVTGINTGDRPPPVDDLLRQIFAKHAEKGSKPPIARLQQITECLIDSLVEDQVDVRANIINCIKTVFVLTSTDSSMLSTAKATILLPFLKSATTPEEINLLEHLLKIFRATIPSSPKTSASKFAKDLQAVLIPMINKPPSGTSTLQEVIACFCAVIRGQTHDFGRLVSIFKASFGRLKIESNSLLNPVADSKPANLRSIPMLCNLSALLCEHGDFDSIRNEFPDETKSQIDAISTRSISEEVFSLLIKLYSALPQLQSTLIQALGYLYRAYPTYMLHPSSTKIMDSIFEAEEGSLMKICLLRIIGDFLGCQSQTGVTQKSDADTDRMDELVGNVDGFADSGVSSAVSQRYLTHILTHSISTNPTLQKLSFEILASVARSGFGHPLSVSPTLVALTASSESGLAGKAFAMLSLLHQKHASLLSSRFVEASKITFGYVRSHSGTDVVRGYAEDAHISKFSRWFSLHKDKRVHKIDFLKSLTRTFEIEPGGTCTEYDSTMARFMAEALSSLEFKNQEEVFTIIHYLNSALAVSGLQVLHLIEEGMEGGGGILGGSPVKGGNGEMIFAPNLALASQSIICGLALLLRDHLKQLYSVTDVKISKFVIGKKSPLGDRAAIRKVDAPVALGLDDYARMPFALSPLITKQDRILQRDTYIGLVQDDGTILEVEEDDE